MANSASPSRITGEVEPRSGEGLGVTRTDEVAFASIRDDFGNAAHSGRDDWQAKHQGIHQRHR